MSERIKLPRNAADLLKPETKDYLRRAQATLNAMQRLKMVINSRGVLQSQSTIQISDGGAELTGTATVGHSQFFGVIRWLFGGTTFTITPRSVALINASTLRLTFTSNWTLAAPGSIPLGAFNDAGYSSSISTFNGNANPSGGDNIETVDLPISGAYIIQVGTNFTGNYTSPGNNGVTGLIRVYPYNVST